MTETELQEFIQAYIEAALWSSTDDNDEPLDSLFNIEDLPEETITKLTADCRSFVGDSAVWPYLTVAIESDGYSIEQAGRDFWLTRNRHGVGFWDRDLGDIGDRLTTAAHAYSERTLYMGDDGNVYVY